MNSSKLKSLFSNLKPSKHFKISTTKRTYAMPSTLSILQHVKNVNNRPLTIHSKDPLTGFFRTGFCETSESDTGSHTIAGILTSQFLTFSASKGNDLRTIGLTEGCKWCLCVSRWKEAFDAFERGEVGRDTVPLVDLEATNVKALEVVKREELGRFDVRGPEKD